MMIKIIGVLLLCALNLASSAEKDGFTFNGFLGANLSTDGMGAITGDGLLQLTNGTKEISGHAFYPTPFQFRNSPSGNVPSFSSTFVFGIVSEYSDFSGHGIAFAIAPSKDFRQAIGSQYLGLFNLSNNGNSTNHILAVELDTILNPELKDMNNNHVGIDINGLMSFNATTAGYFAGDGSGFHNLTMISGDPMQVWVDYNGAALWLDVTMSPMGESKPNVSLLSSKVNLSEVLLETMYLGFSSSSDPFLTSHYILGWSFTINGEAEALNLSALPSLPRKESSTGSGLAIWLSLTAAGCVLAAASVVAFMMLRRNKYSELLEDWELDYGPHRFSYRDLYRATKGFRDEQLLGAGGFGKVYRGVLPTTKIEVAVKRISHESRQGMREFIAEIVSMGQLRHRNLVQLLGYCRRKGEMILVYDFMPNGSLDKYLFGKSDCFLNWSSRFQIIKGVGSGLLYLHEEWEQVVIHRDIKSSNILLDRDLNGRLGDFGLARLYDHGTDPQTTHVVGTMGYLAPELSRTGKVTKSTDVYAFGTFLLEVACGRRPIEPQAQGDELILLWWVLASWSRGSILEVVDPKLGTEYVMEEVELVLKLGLLCSHPKPSARPNMRQAVHILDGDLPLPEFSYDYLNSERSQLMPDGKFQSFGFSTVSYPTTVASMSSLREGR